MTLTRTDLGEPVPRHRELPIEDVWYAVAHRTYLPVPEHPPLRTFFDVVEARETRRDFQSVGLDVLSTLLWFTAKTRRMVTLPSGFVWQHRPVPSAGGRHPIDLLVLCPVDGRWVVSVYDEMAHALCELQVDSLAVEAFVQAVFQVIPPGDGTIIWQVAHPWRTLAKYECGESLVWRDSGVLLGHLTLVGEALDLNCCPLGITGHDHIRRLMGMSDVVGMGGCVVGSRGKGDGRAGLAGGR